MKFDEAEPLTIKELQYLTRRSRQYLQAMKRSGFEMSKVDGINYATYESFREFHNANPNWNYRTAYPKK